MGKKKTKQATPDASGDAAALTHSPFAALAGALPEAPVGPTPDEPAAERSAPEPSAGRFEAKVVVSREKKGRGGKTVTRVRGIAADARSDLAQRMKKALGCGASVEGEDVLLHGSLVDRAADWLEAEGARRVSRSP